MTKKQFLLCALSLMTALAWGQSPVVKVEGGLVQGVASASSDVTVFKGIPYAAPPVRHDTHANQNEVSFIDERI